MNQVTVKDLVEEAKKRIVLLVICVVGVSYLMSLTSSSVLVNLPAAASLIVLLRYLALDYEMRRKAAAYNSKLSLKNTAPQKKPIETQKLVVDKLEWKRKVNSPMVEDAIDLLTRLIVSEWVIDLWYSKLTPDKEGPEELVQIINGVVGEISSRLRNINLIDLLTRDIVNLICTHLELFHASQAKLEKKKLRSLSVERRDVELKIVLAAEDKLHPALFSADAQHKVLQHLMDALISFTFKPEDLQCFFFRYMARELLAAAVMRPVFNLASPRFINERIEVLVLNRFNKGNSATEESTRSKPSTSPKIAPDHFCRYLDPKGTGVELVELKNDQSKIAANKSAKDGNGTHLSMDPLLLMDAQSTRSWSSLPSESRTMEQVGLQHHSSGGEWGDMLDVMSRRKTQALAPEHFDNMWAKGRNYRRKEGKNQDQFTHGSTGPSDPRDQKNVLPKPKDKNGTTKVSFPENRAVLPVHKDHLTAGTLVPNTENEVLSGSPATSFVEVYEHNLMPLEDLDSGSSSSYPTEDDETNNITGLDSPGTKVWDGRNNRNPTASHIHHPLESFEGHTRKMGKGPVHLQRVPRTQSSRKRSRLSSRKVQVWQEVERTSFFSGDGQDILSSLKKHAKDEDTSDDETEILGRVHSGVAASSSAPSSYLPESRSLSGNYLQNSMLTDSFLKLRCEVLGANIVRSGCKTFAVYSISVTDINNNSWSIKRRFRHFEELHRRLKEFPEYNLHLPPKHFLSTGLDVPVIRERCKLLDKYLKKLLQLPTVSGSIEVWDFLSVDSQTYMFLNSISIVETLSVDLEDKPHEIKKSTNISSLGGLAVDPLFSKGEQFGADSKESKLGMKPNMLTVGSRLNAKGITHSPMKGSSRENAKLYEESGSDSDSRVQINTSSRKPVKTTNSIEDDGLEGPSEPPLDASTDPTLPTELQDGGWIRRKAFWVAKQVLQLGMGDAFDDWLIEKIQLLRKGSVIAAVIKRLEQILWPDGIFISKHPKRIPPTQMSSSQSSVTGSSPISSPRILDNNKQPGNECIMSWEEQQKQEAERRAKFVYELMIDKAPPAIVGLVGRKEYEQCAKDLYFFLQSSVCLKQLAFDLLELLLLSAFPEMDYAFRQLHEEKHKFGELILE
ncbi:Sorting nexin, C-terminal [Dillenia turbinata]|uniref:Sorting nexin, C-terminal n=1 Tax=Dillenia turbinata TaxID=194707 RepID=A0AAN8UQP8_9MAGN